MDVLVEAAAQVFAREGLSATTNRIAERAGVSIGTLYQYFPDKHAMLRAVAHRHVGQAQDRFAALFARLRVENPPFDQTMTALLAELVDLHREGPTLHALLHRLTTTGSDLEELTAFENRICREVAFHLQRCGRADGADADRLAHSLVHTVDAQLHRVLTRHGYHDALEQLQRVVTQLVPPAA